MLQEYIGYIAPSGVPQRLIPSKRPAPSATSRSLSNLLSSLPAARDVPVCFGAFHTDVRCLEEVGRLSRHLFNSVGVAVLWEGEGAC